MRRARGRRDADERDLARARLADEQSTLTPHGHAQVALAYPSPYRVGMSSLGYQTLYRHLNELGITTHRAFLPDAWEPATLQWPPPRSGVWTYEGQRPLSDHRVIAVSVAYELEVVGLIRLLEGAGVPVLARDRGERDPVVLVGGPLTGTDPSAILPFADLVLFGEGEAILPDAVEHLLAARRRHDGIDAVASQPWAIRGTHTRDQAVELPASARAPAALLPARSAIVTPHTELANMFLLEPERGCSRRCTFCVMRGATTGGMRIFDPQTTLAHVPAFARKVGLVGAAVTDLPHIEALVAQLVERGLGVGISSLRADRLTPHFLALLRRAGYQAITVASDGISQRLRDSLDRKIHTDDLERAADLVGKAGFRHLKVYQMIGVPGETDADVDELVATSKRLAARVPLVFTFSTFVAKRNTPLDGLPFAGIEVARARLRRIEAELGGVVQIRPQPPRWAYVEYELAQRGAEVGWAALEAVHAGGSFAAWKRALAGCRERGVRVPCYGDEARVAGRRGFAAARPRLPVLAGG